MSEQAPEVITAAPPAAQKKEKDPKKVAAGQALAAYNRAAKEEQIKRMGELVELERRHAEREAAQAGGYFTKNQLLVAAGVGAGAFCSTWGATGSGSGLPAGAQATTTQ